VAPLLFCELGDLMALINAYHGGLGFINTRTGYSISMNFDAYPEFSHAIFPKITKLVNGSYDLDWTNEGKLFVYEGLNATYWNKLNYAAANMTGTQFMQFIAWASKANTTYLYYNLWSVYNQFPTQPLFPGFECFSFVNTAFRVIKSLGGIVPETTFKETIATIYSTTVPVELDMNDPGNQALVVDFFTSIQNEWNADGVLGFFESLTSILTNGLFIIYDSGHYYLVKLVDPDFNLNWSVMPVLN